MEPEENDELSFENELERLKIQGEFGATFFTASEGLPPEIEAEWLKNVRAFEENYAKTPIQTMRETLGNPVLTPLEQISPENVEGELEKLLGLLGTHNIAIDHDDDVPPQEIYRFLMEDLMDKELDAFGSFGMGMPGVPGMVTHLIYEEYYPNHYKDIIRHCESFAERLFDRKEEYLDSELDDGLVFSTGQIMSKEEFVEKAKAWFANHISFTLTDLRFMKPEFSLEQQMGHVHTWLEYDAMGLDGSITNFKGPGIFYMHYLFDYWHICGMDFPGFKEWALE